MVTADPYNCMIKGWHERGLSAHSYADLIKPDEQNFETMLLIMQDFNICKEMFDHMSREVDRCGFSPRLITR